MPPSILSRSRTDAQVRGTFSRIQSIVTLVRTAAAAVHSSEQLAEHSKDRDDASTTNFDLHRKGRRSSFRHLKVAKSAIGADRSRMLAATMVKVDAAMRIIRAIVAGTHAPETLAAYRDIRCAASEETICAALAGNYRNRPLRGRRGAS